MKRHFGSKHSYSGSSAVGPRDFFKLARKTTRNPATLDRNTHGTLLVVGVFGLHFSTLPFGIVLYAGRVYVAKRDNRVQR